MPTTKKREQRLKQKQVISNQHDAMVAHFNLRRLSIDGMDENLDDMEMAIRKIEESERRHWRNRLAVPMDPDNFFRRVWDVSILLVVVFQALYIPFELSFSPLETYGWKLFDYLTDGFFMIDVILTFNVALPQKGSDRLILDRRVIAWKYLRGWFIVDVLASLPIDVMVQGGYNLDNLNQHLNVADSEEGDSGLQSLGLLKGLKLPRLLRLLKLMRLMRILKMAKIRPELIWWFQYSRNSNIFKLLAMIVAILVFVHVLTCSFAVVMENVWFSRQDCEEFSTAELSQIIGLDYLGNNLTSTMTDVELSEKWDRNVPMIGCYEDLEGHWTRYATAFYNTMLLIQGEQIDPFSSYEKMYCAMQILVGSIVLALVFGNVSMYIANYSANSSAYQRKMEYLFEIMRHLDLPQNLMKRILMYYDYIWKEYRSLNGQIDGFIPELSKQLGSEVYLYLRTNLILSVPFLRQCSPEVVQKLVQCLETEVFLPNDYIVHKGVPGEEMYLISRGVCEVTVTDITNKRQVEENYKEAENKARAQIVEQRQPRRRSSIVGAMAASVLKFKESKPAISAEGSSKEEEGRSPELSARIREHRKSISKDKVKKAAEAVVVGDGDGDSDGPDDDFEIKPRDNNNSITKKLSERIMRVGSSRQQISEEEKKNKKGLLPPEKTEDGLLKSAKGFKETTVSAEDTRAIERMRQRLSERKSANVSKRKQSEAGGGGREYGSYKERMSHDQINSSLKQLISEAKGEAGKEEMPLEKRGSKAAIVPVSGIHPSGEQEQQRLPITQSPLPTAGKKENLVSKKPPALTVRTGAESNHRAVTPPPRRQSLLPGEIPVNNEDSQVGGGELPNRRKSGLILSAEEAKSHDLMSEINKYAEEQKKIEADTEKAIQIKTLEIRKQNSSAVPVFPLRRGISTNDIGDDSDEEEGKDRDGDRDVVPKGKSSPKLNALRDIIKTEKVLKEMGEGDYFGEIALILNTTRTCNVRAKTFCELNILNREDFDTIVGKYEDERKLMEEIIMEKFNVNKGSLDESRNMKKVEYDHQVALDTNAGTVELKEMVMQMQVQIDTMMELMQHGGQQQQQQQQQQQGKVMTTQLSPFQIGAGNSLENRQKFDSEIGGKTSAHGITSKMTMHADPGGFTVRRGEGMPMRGGSMGNLSLGSIGRGSSRMGLVRRPSMQKVVESEEEIEEKRKASIRDREEKTEHAKVSALIAKDSALKKFQEESGMIAPGSIQSFSENSYQERVRGMSADLEEEKGGGEEGKGKGNGNGKGGKEVEEEEDFDKLVASLDRGGPGMMGMETPLKGGKDPNP